jgi:uncharacterized protein YbjT (DUF2867 family)
MPVSDGAELPPPELALVECGSHRRRVMILVTGATGNVGGEVVRELAARGSPVRAVVRSGSQGMLPGGVEAVPADLSRPDTLAPALDGVRAVFLLPGYPSVADLLAPAGVERVVLLSGSSAEGGHRTDAVSSYMVASEAAVRDSGVAWTILRPSAFMTNTLQWAPQLQAGDLVRAPFAGVRQAVLDPADIAAEALLGEGHAGHVYRLSGPESLLPEDRVRILGTVLGRPLRFEAQPDDEARAEMLAAMPAAYVDAFFSFYVEGTLDESPVLPTVEEVTGRPPGTFERWARAHRDAFG